MLPPRLLHIRPFLLSALVEPCLPIITKVFMPTHQFLDLPDSPQRLRPRTIRVLKTSLHFLHRTLLIRMKLSSQELPRIKKSAPKVNICFPHPKIQILNLSLQTRNAVVGVLSGHIFHAWISSESIAEARVQCLAESIWIQYSLETVHNTDFDQSNGNRESQITLLSNSRIAVVRKDINILQLQSRQ